jgi:hypothetical protein
MFTQMFGIPIRRVLIEIEPLLFKRIGTFVSTKCSVSIRSLQIRLVQRSRNLKQSLLKITIRFEKKDLSVFKRFKTLSTFFKRHWVSSQCFTAFNASCYET